MLRALILALVLTGCAAGASTFIRPADLYHPVEYPFWHDAIYADIFWRCNTPEGGGVRIEGYAITSTRSSMFLSNFEVRLTAQDPKGNILADRWTYGDILNADQFTPVPFTISVPATGDRVRYDLYYRFTLPDGNGNGVSSGSHRGRGVRSVAARGTLDYFGTIEDVCSDRWRKKTAPPGP